MHGTARLGVWSLTGAVATVRTLSGLGFDWICLDQQHGAVHDADLPTATVARGDLELLVRVRSNDAGLIGRALDAGADGVIVPMVETVADAARAAAACRYQPRGVRSLGPALGPQRHEEPAERDRAVRCLVMVETAAALAAVEDLAAVDGVDELFVGPADLGLSLGLGPEAVLADDVDAPLPRVLAAGRAAGIPAGVFAGSPGVARRCLDLGFDRVAAVTDDLLLTLGAELAHSRLAPAHHVTGRRTPSRPARP